MYDSVRRALNKKSLKASVMDEPVIQLQLEAFKNLVHKGSDVHEERSHLNLALKLLPLGWLVDQKKNRVRTEVIYDIVRSAKNILGIKASNAMDELVGIQPRLEALQRLVDLDSNNDVIGVIGICGMRESGKTTLASLLYHRISHKFDAFCFLQDVTTVSAIPNGTLHYLRNLDLHGSKYLIQTPDFKRLPNLEKLNLEGCDIGLVVLDPSITFHKNLKSLNLRNCTSLVSVPNNLFGLTSLEILNLAGCSKFAECLDFDDDWMSATEGDEEVLSNQDLPLFQEIGCGINREHASSSTITADDEYPIARCIEGLDEVDDVSDDSYIKALEKFKDPYWRQVFLTMSQKRKKAWLNKLV
ncbi:TMV resistance protein N [Senna tora]|uniref:TMV resistance protein N n=1 Tax=Senna tora TaxID=362788 RepID=A0A834X9T2_9FABA|nr:TMV resistance protein N [Senna tora]